MKRSSRFLLALFLALVALSAVAATTMLSAISLTSATSVTTTGSLDKCNEPTYGITLQGDPKGGGWG